MVLGQPREIVHEPLISKITRTKWTGDNDQGVECLLCKHEALISNPKPTKN
jgi:hypothetical protein